MDEPAEPLETITYSYDALGRLFNVNAEGGTVVTFTHDGDEISSEIDQVNGPVLRRYVYGPGADEPLVWYEGSGTGDKRWPVADERGSVVAVTDAGGAARAINAYDEHGIPSTTNAAWQGRFGYTGQAWLPSLGMWYYKARVYSPTLGRFVQTDPIGYGDGLNWYDYTGGDPVNGSDPSGLTTAQPKPRSPLPASPRDITVTANRIECQGICVTDANEIAAFKASQFQPTTPGLDIPELSEVVVTANVAKPQNDDIVVTASLNSFLIKQAIKSHPEILTNTINVIGRLTDGRLSRAETDYLTDFVINDISVSNALKLQGVKPTLPLVLTPSQMSVVRGVISDLPTNQTGINVRSYFQGAIRAGRIRIGQ